MREVNLIVIHCSATESGQEYSVETIDSWHLKRGFRKIGYHYLIHLDGSISSGKDGMRQLDEIGAHAKGYNNFSIGICYIGGIKAGRATDTRTPEQKKTMKRLVEALQVVFPSAEKVVGHRDLSPDKNKDGKITEDEYMKQCPCFDVATEF